MNYQATAHTTITDADLESMDRMFAADRSRAFYVSQGSWAGLRARLARAEDRLAMLRNVVQAGGREHEFYAGDLIDLLEADDE